MVLWRTKVCLFVVFFVRIEFEKRKMTFISKSSSTCVGIIGSAGRLDDAKRMTKTVFEWMVQRTKHELFVVRKLKPNEITLVSGGSSWADHVVVYLFLEYLMTDPFAGLLLCFPTPFDDRKEQFIETDCGQTLNGYHQAFGKLIGRNSLHDLRTVRALDGVKCVSNAKTFHARNTQIAQASQILLAFSWAPLGSLVPKKPGGTHDTWSKCKGLKQHISLFESLLKKDDGLNVLVNEKG
jgi:hypothetical protein